MTDVPDNALDVSPQPTQNPPTNAALFRTMLARRAGASLAELVTATGWQKHSVRGQLSAMRKAGAGIGKTERQDGTAAYVLIP